MNDLVDYNDYIDQKIEAENKFNIFTALHNERDEKRLHSRFIAYLLSPQSKHGMGSEFLKLFVNNLPKLENNFIVDDNCKVYPNEQDKSEKNFIDILIINEVRKQAIIIENKLYARDSDHKDKEKGFQIQIEGYYNNIKNKYKDTFVIYLTIEGREPEQFDKIESHVKEKIKLISYKKEIHEWLEKCEGEIKNDNMFREIIGQYKDVIEKITNFGVTPKKNDKSIEKLLKTIGDNWEIAFERKNAFKLNDFKHVKWHTVFDFWKELEAELEIRGYEIDKPISEDEITNFFKNSRTLGAMGIGFHKEKTDKLYIVCDGKGFTYGNLDTKRWDRFSNDRLKEIEFSKFEKEGTFKMINQTNRKDIINEILKESENFPNASIQRKN